MEKLEPITQLLAQAFPVLGLGIQMTIMKIITTINTENAWLSTEYTK